MVIAVDFDGTIVEHQYPEIGNELPFATTTLRMLANENHRLILWTVRHGKLLDEAIVWCKEHGVEFYAINKNHPEEKIDNESGFCKINADIFIDDRNLGGLPNWGDIYNMIKENRSWKDVYSSKSNKEEPAKRKKKGWFW